MNSTAYVDVHLRSAALVRANVSGVDPTLAKVTIEDGQLQLSFVATDPAPLLELANELRAAAGLLQAATVKAGAA